MNWDAIGAIAELLGALGVIASLIYLAVQIRQNTESVRITSHHGIADQFQQANIAIVQDAEVSDLLLRGLSDTSRLSEVEHLRFEGCLISIFRTYEELYHLYRRGFADHELWESRDESMMRWLSFPGVRSWWSSESAKMFTTSFRTHVDQLRGKPAPQQGAAADTASPGPSDT